MRLLYFSPVTWHSYYQRPHYLIEYFLQQNKNNEVLWVNPYANRFPEWQDFRRLRQPAKKPSALLNNLRILSVSALPIEPIPKSEWLNFNIYWRKIWDELKNFVNKQAIIGIGRPSKLALRAIQELSVQWNFYDAMDDFPEFYRGISQWSMRNTELKIAKIINKLFVSSTALEQKFQSLQLQPIKILNAYPMQSLPVLNHKSQVNPLIFGFVGTIGQWFDWPMVIKLARAFPEAIIRLIGPRFIATPENLPENIQLLPECTQPEAVKYIQEFDLGLIPFKQTQLTRGVDPIKYYEYRGMGLPIISTKFGEMLYKDNKDGVYFIADAADLRSIIKQALQHTNSIEEISEFRKLNAWTTRFQLIGFNNES